MHPKTRRALADMQWTADVLRSAYVRDSRIYSKFMVRTDNVDLDLLNGVVRRTVPAQQAKGGIQYVSLEIALQSNPDAIEFELDAPLKSTYLHKWTNKAIGVRAVGKTFFYSPGRKAERQGILLSWRKLRKEVTAPSPDDANVANQRHATIMGMKGLIRDLIAQLHMSRSDTIEAVRQRDLYKTERDTFLRQRDEARAELARQSKTGLHVVRGKK